MRRNIRHSTIEKSFWSYAIWSKNYTPGCKKPHPWKVCSTITNVLNIMNLSKTYLTLTLHKSSTCCIDNDLLAVKDLTGEQSLIFFRQAQWWDTKTNTKINRRSFRSHSTMAYVTHSTRKHQGLEFHVTGFMRKCSKNRSLAFSLIFSTSPISLDFDGLIF